MPNGGNPPTPPRPATVTAIGVGEAGCRMLASVADAVDRTDPEPSFEYVAVDSRAEDLEEVAPADAERIGLEPPERTFAADRDARGYLVGTHKLPRGGGAARQRPVGRYYLDSEANFDAVYDQLSTVLERTAAESTQAFDANGATAHHVWLLSSLGGGTGSGAVPLLAALVDELAPSDTWLFGLGSFEQPTGLGETLMPSLDSGVAYNTYTALRELRVLLGFDDDPDHYPIDLPVRAAADRLDSEAITLERSPIEAYGLVPIDPGATADPDERAAANRRAADLVVGSARVPGLLDAGPAHDAAVGAALFSVDTGGVAVPDEDVDALLDSTAEIRRIDGEIDADETTARSLERAADAIDRLLHRHPGDDVDGVFVPPRAVEVAASGAEALASPESDAAFDAVVHRVRRELDEAVPADLDHDADLSPDTASVAALLVGQESEARLDEALDEHPFREEIERFTEEFADAIDDGVEDESDPTAIWRRTVAPLLRQRRALLDRTADELLAVRISRRRALESERDRVRKRVARLDQLRDDYERLQSRRATAERERRDAESALRSTEADLDERRTAIERRVDGHRDRRRDLERRRDALREQLTTATDGRYRRLRIDDLDSLDAELYAAAESLGDLIDAGVLDRRVVAESVHATLEALEEPVQDRMPAEVPNHPTSSLAVSIAESTLDHVDDASDRLDGVPTVSARFAEFDHHGRFDEAGTPAVGAVATFEGVRLENSSAFGVIDDYYADPDRAVGELFGDASTDDRAVADRFAYPELLDEGDAAIGGDDGAAVDGARD